jgi:hypothetical protein
VIAQRPGEREREREREVSARGTSTYCGGAVLLQGRGEKVVGDLPAVRIIAPDATNRPYYLASIATSAESNNVANSGDSMALAARSTQDVPPAVDLHVT